MLRLALFLFAVLPSLASAQQVLTRVVVVDADTRAFLDGITIQLQPVDPAIPVVEAVTTSAGGSAGTATSKRSKGPSPSSRAQTSAAAPASAASHPACRRQWHR